MYTFHNSVIISYLLPLGDTILRVRGQPIDSRSPTPTCVFTDNIVQPMYLARACTQFI